MANGDPSLEERIHMAQASMAGQNAERALAHAAIAIAVALEELVYLRKLELAGQGIPVLARPKEEQYVHD
jgi:hypothetical protein